MKTQDGDVRAFGNHQHGRDDRGDQAVPEESLERDVHQRRGTDDQSDAGYGIPGGSGSAAVVDLNVIYNTHMCKTQERGPR